MAGAGEPVADWLARVVALHDLVIKRYGGASGVLDDSLLQAAIERPWAGLADGTQYFPDVLDKAAVLLERLINYHPFVDGNKRTATILVFEFLRQQGFISEAETTDIVDTAVRIATRRMSPGEIKVWLERITSVRVRPLAEPIPCPWCGSQDVETRVFRYSQTSQVAPGGARPEVHRREFYVCRGCGVTYWAGDHILVIDRERYLLHQWGFGDPQPDKVVTGPWGTESGERPQTPGSVTIAKQDVSFPAYGHPTRHLTEVIAAVRARRRA